ncbi:MAG TPA: helix-turn-helix domain-containing protein [Longimicrobiales bacterium]|nr:helix-turn-helix domain-containing protein [Longimicrobiales bacterium]
MSISYEDGGRAAQKTRTRTTLIAAARELIADGMTPTVEDVASRASISRATAYRYFPNRHELLVAAHPEVEVASLLGENPPADPEARLDAVVTALAQIFLEAEESYRSMLRLSLEPDAADRGELALRKGRRFIWLEDALAPVQDRLGERELGRLVNALATVVGIEALVTLIDLGGLPRDQAVEVMRWSARSLLWAALQEAAEG